MEMGKEVLILNLDDVLPNRFQPRIKFNEQSILELAESIKEHGVIQPIVVRKIADKYEIIAGERRYKASILAGKTTIPAIVTSLDDKNSAEIALIENVQRQDLTPIEEAISYKKILDMGYISQAALAEKLGKTQSTIANKLRLLNLADEVQEALLEEKISERHARSLLKLNKEEQLKMLNRIMNERMTVRKTDEEIMKILNSTEDQTDSGEQLKVQSENIPVPNNIDSLSLKSDNTIGNNISFQPMTEDKILQNNVISKSIEEKNSQINPGFMDIDRIESQAQDIFLKPEAKKEELILEVTPEKVENKESVSTITQPAVNDGISLLQERKEPRPIVGKFFNMMNMNSGEKPNQNYINDLEEKEVNMDFSKPVESPSSDFEIQPLTTAEQQPFEINVNTTPHVEVPIENSQSNQFITQPNFGKPNAIHMPITTTSIEGDFDTLQTINPYTLNDDSEFSGPVNSQVEMPNPVENIVNINNVEIQPKMDDDEESTSTVDMKTIINTIRDSVSKIESYGYTVDEEEMDLENTYQVTITIDKK